MAMNMAARMTGSARHRAGYAANAGFEVEVEAEERVSVTDTWFSRIVRRA
jgi:hypothetical protein